MSWEKNKTQPQTMPGNENMPCEAKTIMSMKCNRKTEKEFTREVKVGWSEDPENSDGLRDEILNKMYASLGKILGLSIEVPHRFFCLRIIKWYMKSQSHPVNWLTNKFIKLLISMNSKEISKFRTDQVRDITGHSQIQHLPFLLRWQPFLPHQSPMVLVTW